MNNEKFKKKLKKAIVTLGSILEELEPVEEKTKVEYDSIVLFNQCAQKLGEVTEYVINHNYDISAKNGDIEANLNGVSTLICNLKEWKRILLCCKDGDIISLEKNGKCIFIGKITNRVLYGTFEAEINE